MNWACELSRLQVPCENHSNTSPRHPWKNCFPENLSLVPERKRTALLRHLVSRWACYVKAETKPDLPLGSQLPLGPFFILKVFNY